MILFATESADVTRVPGLPDGVTDSLLAQLIWVIVLGIPFYATIKLWQWNRGRADRTPFKRIVSAAIATGGSLWGALCLCLVAVLVEGGFGWDLGIKDALVTMIKSTQRVVESGLRWATQPAFNAPSRGLVVIACVAVILIFVYRNYIRALIGRIRSLRWTASPVENQPAPEPDPAPLEQPPEPQTVVHRGVDWRQDGMGKAVPVCPRCKVGMGIVTGAREGMNFAQPGAPRAYTACPKCKTRTPLNVSPDQVQHEVAEQLKNRRKP